MLCIAAQAITWSAPTLKTTTSPVAEETYFLYHIGRQQMLTYGAKWGTHAVLDSTGVNALAYYIKESENGYTLYSSQAGGQGMLFRENTGTGVYTDYNNNGYSSIYWDFTESGKGSVYITTAANDYIWGEFGYMVNNDENTYRLGWNPNAEDLNNNNYPLGTNQSIYMLSLDLPGIETEWAFVATSDYELYKARTDLYTLAVKADQLGVDYARYTTAYNGTDINAILSATNSLKADIKEGEGGGEGEEEEEDEEEGDTLFIALRDTSTMILPEKYIVKQTDNGQYLEFTLRGDTTVTIAKGNITSMGNTYQEERPQFKSFKFNNKFNDQLFTDVTGTIDNENHRVTAQVGCIGKRLTPSFQLPEGASAYVNGKRQHSKKTRLRFDEPVRYTVAYPKQYIYKVIKTKDEVWSNPETSDDQWLDIKMELTGDMFSTNAPSNNGEDPANMLDGNHNTIFHSTWGSGSYSPLEWYDGAYYGDGKSEWPYLQIELPEPLYRLRFEYTTRNSGSYWPLGLLLQGSNDGEEWYDVQTFTSEKDELPTAADATYLSPIINMGTSYSYLRLQLTASQRKNYLVFSEFALYKVEENPNFNADEPTLLSPAEYKKGFVPYGTDYDVEVDFLTDHPTSEYNVPRVDIWFGDRETWSSTMWIGMNGKKYFEDATIKIDGAGVFPDMEETPIQIRGRGNSSWSQSYNSKNPYRLKFFEENENGVLVETKKKPFGMTKGKSWVLLANKQSGSMTTNAIAMKIADMVESRGCNHIVPVELYVNNQYRGSYNFTEKIGFSNNSIDIDDETYATMLELDSYYDETYKFRDNYYNLPVNVKEPDFSDADNGSALIFSDVETAFNDFTYDVKNYYDGASLDIESVVRAMLVNDLVRNEECKHPKSWYIYNENIQADSLWNLGPVWDFDWAYGYEGGGTYFIRNAEIDLFSSMSSSNTGAPFFQQLLRGSDKVKKEYYRLWTNFIQSGKLDELIEFCDDYFQYVQPSFIHNYNGVTNEEYDYWSGTTTKKTGWNDGKQYATQTTNAKNYLTKRANYIYTHLDTYDLSEDIVDPEENDDDYGNPTKIDLSEVASKLVNVYTINGILVRRQVPLGQFNIGLMPGIYIVDGKKMVIR